MPSLRWRKAFSSLCAVVCRALRRSGSAIRRIGYPRWRRNLAVAMGNALRAGIDGGISQALGAALEGADELVAEHVRWALAQRARHGVASDRPRPNQDP